MDNQPKLTAKSTIKKCCPLNQNYKYEMGKRYCANSSYPFKVQAIQAKFYDHCIEDEEVNILIDVSIENNCKRWGSWGGDKVIIVKCTLNVSFYFSGLVFNEQYEDILYVIQNGSLLRIDADFQSFDIYEHYCLDMDEQTGGMLTAIVCEFDDMLFRVNHAQALIFAACMLISVPVSDIHLIWGNSECFWEKEEFF